MSYMTINAVTEDGEPVEAFIEVTDAKPAPRLGDKFEDEGRMLTRVPTVFGVHVSRRECVCYDLPRRDAAIREGKTLAPHYNSKGYAVFTDSARESREYQAAHNDNPKNGSQISWNCDGNE